MTRPVIIIIIIIIVYDGRESFVRYHGRIVGVLREYLTVYVTLGRGIGVRIHRARLFHSLRRCPYLDKLAPKLCVRAYVLHNVRYVGRAAAQ